MDCLFQDMFCSATAIAMCVRYRIFVLIKKTADTQLTIAHNDDCGRRSITTFLVFELLRIHESLPAEGGCTKHM